MGRIYIRENTNREKIKRENINMENMNGENICFRDNIYRIYTPFAIRHTRTQEKKIYSLD